MSALFLLMMPAVGLAAYRVLVARRASTRAAVAGAVVITAALTVLPAYALRTKPSTGEPLETPFGPAFAETNAEGVELLVDFGPGWSAPTPLSGQTVRTLTGRGTVVVGPLQSRRPPARLSFEATASASDTLVFRFDERVLTEVAVGPEATRATVDVPEGQGPAVLDVAVGSGGEIAVVESSIRAIARTA